MIISNDKFKESLIDLKNIFIYSEWYKEVVKLLKKPKNLSWKQYMFIEKRAVITETYLFGLICFPSGWTTFSPTILKSIMKDYDNVSKPFIKENFGCRSLKEFLKDDIYKKVYKHWKSYINGFITAKTDKDYYTYKKFQTTKSLSKAEESEYALKYLDLLNSYIDEETPLYDACKQIRLIIMSLYKK